MHLSRAARRNQCNDARATLEHSAGGACDGLNCRLDVAAEKDVSKVESLPLSVSLLFLSQMRVDVQSSQQLDAFKTNFLLETRRQNRTIESYPQRPTPLIQLQKIGQNLNRHTKAFTCLHRHSSGSDCDILHLSATPGGFLQAALRKNPRAHRLGYTLPVVQGGHRLLIAEQSRLTVAEADITMLAQDMGIDTRLESHLDLAYSQPRQFTAVSLFDLIICGGQAFPTHVRLLWREKREARRLSATRMGLALDYVKPGNTIIILSQKLVAWRTVSLIHAISTLALVRLFKPPKSHAKLSSCYFVILNAKGVRSSVEQLEYSKRGCTNLEARGTLRHRFFSP
ncbi:hypothetical protein LTR49_027319 [Elasticomyces elasticus]|nr:hypothetical protein LTR49_027319 [Elasticomyces elasticus]